MFWKVLSRTLHSIFGIGGLVMQGFGIYFDVVQATQIPQIWGVSILHIGIASFTIVAISVIAQLWWHIHRIEAPIGVIMQELKRETIVGFSLLKIYDVLRKRFALGLTYPQVHDVLRSQLNKDIAWGIHSSDILAKFTTLGLIHSTSIDPKHSVLLDDQRTIPNYVYQLTDRGKLLACKLKSQKPKIGKEGSQP